MNLDRRAFTKSVTAAVSVLVVSAAAARGVPAASGGPNSDLYLGMNWVGRVGRVGQTDERGSLAGSGATSVGRQRTGPGRTAGPPGYRPRGCGYQKVT